jgi:hypothetical protein
MGAELHVEVESKRGFVFWYGKSKTRGECMHRSATHAAPNAIMPLNSIEHRCFISTECTPASHVSWHLPTHRLIKSISEKSGGFLP